MGSNGDSGFTFIVKDEAENGAGLNAGPLSSHNSDLLIRSENLDPSVAKINARVTAAERKLMLANRIVAKATRVAISTKQGIANSSKATERIAELAKNMDLATKAIVDSIRNSVEALNADLAVKSSSDEGKDLHAPFLERMESVTETLKNLESIRPALVGRSIANTEKFVEKEQAKANYITDLDIQAKANDAVENAKAKLDALQRKLSYKDIKGSNELDIKKNLLTTSNQVYDAAEDIENKVLPELDRLAKETLDPNVVAQISGLRSGIEGLIQTIADDIVSSLGKTADKAIEQYDTSTLGKFTRQIEADQAKADAAQVKAEKKRNEDIAKDAAQQQKEVDKQLEDQRKAAKKSADAVAADADKQAKENKAAQAIIQGAKAKAREKEYQDYVKEFNEIEDENAKVFAHKEGVRASEEAVKKAIESQSFLDSLIGMVPGRGGYTPHGRLQHGIRNSLQDVSDQAYEQASEAALKHSESVRAKPSSPNDYFNGGPPLPPRSQGSRGDGRPPHLPKGDELGLLKINALSEILNTFADSILAAAKTLDDLHRIPVREFGNALIAASTTAKLNPNGIFQGIGNVANAGVSVAGKVGGGIAGGIAGGMIGNAILPGIGTFAGSMVGHGIGGKLGEAASLPFGELIDTSVKSLIVLNEIAANTAAQARPFSSDLIESRINNQLTQLYRNMDRGQELGPILGRIENSLTTFQDSAAQISDDFINIFGDMFTGALDALTGVLIVIRPYLALIAMTLEKSFYLAKGFMMAVNPQLVQIVDNLIKIGNAAKGKGRMINNAINNFFNPNGPNKPNNLPKI